MHARTLFALPALLLMCAPSLPAAEASGCGRRFPSEKSTLTDRTTGLPITVLTNNRDRNARIYQTEPQWTHDERHIVYRSDRGGNGTNLFAVNEGSGEIIQLTDDRTIVAGSVYVSRKTPRLFYVRRTEEQTHFCEFNLEALFADSAAGTSTGKTNADYERVIARLPEGLRAAGGIALDADETTLYTGVDRLGVEGSVKPPEGQSWRIAQVAGGVRAMNVSTGEWRTVVDVPFKIGHIQTNPWVPSELVYCHETGGDAPQRMWTVRGDGSGNRPLFVEDAGDWVTHEVVVGPDEVMFNMLGFLPHLAKRASGIAVINLRTDQVRLLGQVIERVPEGFLGAGGPGGFWHCNGSPDGRWAAGDTFRGDMWLINRRSGEMTLLTTGHLMKPDHIHPSFSPDSSRILIQSGLLTDGANLNLMVVTIPPHLRERH